MPRVIGIDIPGNKRLEVALTYLFGVGRTLSNQIIEKLSLDKDMKAQNQRYTLVVMTEFGRRLISNKSNGTDHGHGSLSLVMGSAMSGEKMMGKWPGLDTAKLDRGVDLAVTTDYLDVLKQAQTWGKI